VVIRLREGVEWTADERVVGWVVGFLGARVGELSDATRRQAVEHLRNDLVGAAKRELPPDALPKIQELADLARGEWLYYEVQDLLDVSSVGLYELLERLPDRAIARRALDHVLDEPGTELVRFRWPWDDLGPVRRDELTDKAWDPPDSEGVYVAVDRDH